MIFDLGRSIAGHPVVVDSCGAVLPVRFYIIAIVACAQGDNVRDIRERHGVEVWIEDPRRDSTACRPGAWLSAAC